MSNLLIADDEKDIIKLLRLYLEKDGINIYEAYDGEMAYFILKNYQIDLALIDIMMPKINGFELTRKVRQECNVPIMIISAKIQTSDIVLGLDFGADDYITKPFDPLEVAARVRARLRRDRIENGVEQIEKLTIRDLTLNLNECVLYKDSKEIELTSTELKILKLLIKNPGRVYTKEQIYEAGWGDSYMVDDNTVRVAISKLRDKIGEQNIKTIRGLGYRLEK